jgi:hypothetical protein
MKVCPACQNQFNDDVETCPDDGTELIPSPDDMPGNPELQEVRHVGADEATAMVDLEAIDAERQRRGIELPQNPLVDAEDEGEEEHDPDATGTINIDQLDSRRRSQVDTEAVTGEGDPEPKGDTQIVPAPSPEAAERTQVTRERKRPDVSKKKKEDKRKKDKAGGKRGLVVAAIVGGSLVLAGAIVAGALYWFSGSRAMLTVTTIPKGATVLLDSEEIGTAPLQQKVKLGSHVLELKLDGYVPFKEVVEVPEEGLPFMQPLDVDENAPPPATADAGPADAGAAAAEDADAGAGGPAAPEDAGAPAPAAASADDLIASFDDLVAKGALDLAFEKLKELVRVYPGDPRSNALFDKLAEARMKAVKRPSGGGKTVVTSKNRTQRAREAFAEGEMYYRERSYPEAKLKYKSAIQLDPKFARPHRAVARIYQREDNVERARYHLERYLGLGGGDPDYKVRRWLEQHPRQ